MRQIQEKTQPPTPILRKSLPPPPTTIERASQQTTPTNKLSASACPIPPSVRLRIARRFKPHGRNGQARWRNLLANGAVRPAITNHRNSDPSRRPFFPPLAVLFCLPMRPSIIPQSISFASRLLDSGTCESRPSASKHSLPRRCSCRLLPHGRLLERIRFFHWREQPPTIKICCWRCSVAKTGKLSQIFLALPAFRPIARTEEKARILRGLALFLWHSAALEEDEDQRKQAERPRPASSRAGNGRLDELCQQRIRRRAARPSANVTLHRSVDWLSVPLGFVV